MATGRAVAKAAITLGRETPCKLLSAVAGGMAINDSPTAGYHGYLACALPGSQVSTLRWDTAGGRAGGRGGGGRSGGGAGRVVLQPRLPP